MFSFNEVALGAIIVFGMIGFLCFMSYSDNLDKKDRYRFELEKIKLECNK